jgi:type VI secretion system secreted protein Hcp
MAASLFVHIEALGNKGEATEVGHPNWIVVKTINWNVERAVDLTDIGGSQRGYGNANFGKIAVTSEMTAISTWLSKYAASGVDVGLIKVDACRASKEVSEALIPYLQFKLHFGQITKYDVTLSEDGVPEESWEMGYREIEVDYTIINPDTFEVAGTADSFTWNLKTGKPR